MFAVQPADRPNFIDYFICDKEFSVKNHADAMIFHTAICAAGVTNSKDHRAE